MTKDQSVYLDLMRFSAAVAVFFSHIGWSLLSGGFLWQLQPLGADAVVVFFVLSGFVIQYCAETKEQTYGAYQVARFARLYSVVLPALFLTFVFDRIGIAHNPSTYLLSLDTHPALSLFAGLTFLAQCWSLDMSVMSNNPFWSLCYEFWYYQIFAALFFLRGAKRALLVAACCLIAGPPILLYFPLWLAGVAAYKLAQTTSLTRQAGVIVFLASLGGAVALVSGDWAGLFPRHGGGGLLPRNFSYMDYALAGLVALNIYAAAFARLPLTRFARPITACAGLTFVLYLVHLPLLHLLASFMPPGLPVPVRGLILLGASAPIIVALSFVTERRKSDWKCLFRRLFGVSSKRLKAQPT